MARQGCAGGEQVRRVKDSNGKEIGYLFWDLVNNEQSETIQLAVEAAAGSRFICDASPVVTLYAREHNVGSFVPLAAGIDLSGYPPGDDVPFDLYAVGAVASGRARDAIFVGVVDEPGRAAWSQVIEQPAQLTVESDAEPGRAFFFRESDMRYVGIRPITGTAQFAGYLKMSTVPTDLQPYTRMSYTRRGSGGFGMYELKVPHW